MATPYQYCLLSAPPEKEEKFRQLKQQFGSCYAYVVHDMCMYLNFGVCTIICNIRFHGSPVENWHSILRNGLKNASGTKFQLNGAAYGSGIYISPHSATSFGYSQIGYGTPNTSSVSITSFVVDERL